MGEIEKKRKEKEGKSEEKVDLGWNFELPDICL